MRHAADFFTPQGTMAMVWVKTNFCNPPEFMHHSPDITDIHGNTVKYYWTKHIVGKAPKWMNNYKFEIMKIGCHHKHEVFTADNLVVCTKCGTGEKVFCEDYCSICRKVYEEENEVGVFNVCKHVFCRACLEEWNNHSDKCPICNK
jgi:hypothetical protein